MTAKQQDALLRRIGDGIKQSLPIVEGFALIVQTSATGDAQIVMNGLTRPDAAKILRMFADDFDPPIEWPTVHN